MFISAKNVPSQKTSRIVFDQVYGYCGLDKLVHKINHYTFLHRSFSKSRRIYLVDTLPSPFWTECQHIFMEVCKSALHAFISLHLTWKSASLLILIFYQTTTVRVIWIMICPFDEITLCPVLDTIICKMCSFDWRKETQQSKLV